MLSCKDAHHWMTRDVDGELDAHDRARLDAHAASCTACREAWAAQDAIARLVRARPPADVPHGFAARVAARLDEPASWAGLAEWRLWTWRLVPVAGALFVVAALLDGRTPASSTPLPASADAVAEVAPVPVETRPEAVFWEDGVTEDQLLLTVLTGRRRSALPETRHE